ncbi:NADH-quinone oxidoreductase subunit C [Actinokineospora iranica]|uniref:NADH-quinone oxidoreductase subunit C n=1 Tax=Actinokineospora iranica TaxID=1271860 RepID=A0A1G6UUJ3_9PSEU|nr:NADH-quinone oxidoreductase subunit C [Actinokineospora iranica]SDD44982.1 NADH dehydrogenase subunit C [Actinokineospora iranica]
MADDKPTTPQADVPGQQIGDENSTAQRPDTGIEPDAGIAEHREPVEPRPVTAGRTRKGMFNVAGTGDTSGFGGLRLPAYSPPPAERPYGGWFDEFADDLAAAMARREIPKAAIQQVTVDRGEITCYVSREHLVALCWALRDEPALRFELCSSVSGVDYGLSDGADVPQRLHSVYHLTSMTFRRRIRLEVAVDVDDPHVPSVVEVYPTADWHEREAWDMFGIVYDGHPALTRILMPDDWDGHPQRKDYPLGGIPVEYKGAEIPPPDQRRSYS